MNIKDRAINWWLTALAAFAPAPILPTTREKDTAPTQQEARYAEEDADYDDEYAGEIFYRGLPILDENGMRTTLLMGNQYVEGVVTLSNGEPLMVWRDARWEASGKPKCTKWGEPGNDLTLPKHLEKYL